MPNDIKQFLKEFETSKKNEYINDGSKTLKDEFKELWDDYISNNQFSQKSQLYLIQGSKFDSAKVFWDFICKKHPEVKNSEKKLKEEIKDDYKGAIPSDIMRLLVFFEELNKQEQTVSSKLQKINKLENIILGLENDIRKLNKELITKQEEIENLKNAVLEEKKLKTVVAKDEAKKVEETYQRISNELNFVYTYYLEEKEMEMTSDLGVVLLDHLEEIFGILSKYGINCGNKK